MSWTLSLVVPYLSDQTVWHPMQILSPVDFQDPHLAYAPTMYTRAILMTKATTEVHGPEPRREITSRIGIFAKPVGLTEITQSPGNYSQRD